MDWLQFLKGIPLPGSFRNGAPRLRSPKNLLALHGMHLFICNGQRLGHVNLFNLKNSTLEAEFKEIPIKEPGFLVTEIVLNTSGKILALVGETQLAVVSLQAFLKNKKLSEPLECLRIGESLFHQSNEIVKVAWHPLSQNASHLAVLSKDACLRLFDVLDSCEEEQQIFPLLGQEEQRKNSILSFCFGKGFGWDQLTLYYTNNVGDVYSLCPCLPFPAILHQDLYDHLCIETKKRWQSEISTEENEDLILAFDTQNLWLESLLVSSMGHPTYLSIQKPVKFHLKPSPQKIYMSQGNRPCQRADITTLGSIPRVILVGNDQGAVSILLSLRDGNPKWIELDEEFNCLSLADNKFLLIELIDFEFRQSSPFHFSDAEGQEFQVDCFHSHGTNRIELPWLPKIVEGTPNEDYLDKLRAVIFESPAKPNHSPHTFGFAKCFNSALGYFTIHLNNRFEVYAEEINVFPQEAAPLPLKDIPFISKEHKDSPVIGAIVADLEKIAQLKVEVPTELRKKKKLDTDAVSSFLQLLSQIHQGQVSKLIVVGEQIAKLRSAQAERADQLREKILRLQKELYAANQANEAELKRVEDAQKTDTLIRNKLDLLAQMVLEANNPALTEGERKAFEEFEKLKFSFDTLQEKLGTLKKELSSQQLSEEPKNQGYLSQEQKQILTNKLRETTEQLQQLHLRAQKLRENLPS